MKVEDIALFGVTGGFLVIALVQLAKEWGLPDSWARRAASVASLLVAGAWKVSTQQSTVWSATDGIQIAVGALLLFMAATGGYNLVNKQGQDEPAVAPRGEGDGA